MERNLDHWLRPPAIAPDTYESVTSGSAWYEPDGDWDRLRFLTDAEASDVSGVPERSLLVLQEADVIRATQAPKSNGGYRRVWHLPEVASAAMVEQFKRCTGANYRDTATMLYQAALFTRAIFLDFCQMVPRNQIFSAEIILTGALIVGRLNYRQRLFRQQRDGLILIAGREDDEWKGFSGDDPSPGHLKMMDRALERFRKAKYSNTVHLTPIFRDLEERVAELRN